MKKCLIILTVPQEQRDKYGVNLEEISNLGPEGGNVLC